MADSDSAKSSMIIQPLASSGDLADNWMQFKMEYHNLIKTFYNHAPVKEKIGLLIRYGGPFFNEALDSFYLTSGQRKDLVHILSAFDEHFLPKTALERNLFFNRKQHLDESCEDYFLTLKIMSDFCDFGDLKDWFLKEAFINGLYSMRLKKILLDLKKSGIDAEGALAISRNKEILNETVRQTNEIFKTNTWLMCCKNINFCCFASLKKRKKSVKNTKSILKSPLSQSKKSSRSKPTVLFNDNPEVFVISEPDESTDAHSNSSWDSSYSLTGRSWRSVYDLNMPVPFHSSFCGYNKDKQLLTIQAEVHRKDEPTDDDHHAKRYLHIYNNIEMLMYDLARSGRDLNGGSNPKIILAILDPLTQSMIKEYILRLMKGSITSENKAERPKTLRKLRTVYDSSKMSGESEDAIEDKVPEKGVLSPFDEQEEWAKITEIMASFGTLVRESVFITELEKEFQERLGLNLNDSSTSVGAAVITSIGSWLASINLSQYEPIFINFGYDNLDFVNGVLDDNDLKEMSIPEDDRKTILESAKTLNNKVSLARNEAVNNNNNEEKSKDSVEDWLEKLDLGSYWDTFRKHLYTDMERVKSVWEVELTAVLEISKPGHRHRIMASLPRSPNQPSIQDINAELSQLKSSMQELEGKVVSSGTGTLRHSHKKTRPAPQPPGKPQPELQIRDPSQLLVGVPSTITAQWRHQPHALLTGTLTYHARYLGSTVVKVLRGAESTKKSIQKLKKPLSEQNTSPDIYLAISYHGVKFLSGETKELVCEHEIRNIHLACQDAEDLTHFAYITKDRATKSHYCHVFSVQTMDQATEVILTLGQAFEVAYQMALREANSSKGNGHTRSFSANLTPITTQPNHNRSHSVNEIKLNGESISNGHTSSTPSVLMSEDV